jgi:hypothetical protein
MQTFPQTIHVGMKVFDKDHDEIGRINDLRFPENAIDPDVEPAELDATDQDNRPRSIIGQIAETFREDDMPEAVRDRLLLEGYLRIDSDAPFAADHFVLPSQVASTTGEEVLLNIGKDELITRH